MTIPIDRGFVRLAEGLVHYRHAGEENAQTVPVFAAHSGPGNSRGLSPLIAEIAKTRRVIAPDMMGNGDSDPPAREDTDIAYYADCAVRVLDALRIEQVDFFGTHTGALVGIELANSHPDRVRRLVLDGVILLDDAMRADWLAKYAPKIEPDLHGSHLSWAFQFCRDMMLFFPYFERDAAHRTEGGVPEAMVLNGLVLDTLKAITTYHCAYRAAFSYDVPTAIAKLTHETKLTCMGFDPTKRFLEDVHALLPAADCELFPAECSPEQVVQAMTTFFDKTA